MTITLPYGLTEAVPETATAAWGARLIVTQDGHVDMPPDRQAFKGTDLGDLGRDMEAAIPLDRLLSRISIMLIDREINTREHKRVVLYRDPDITIVGDTKASAGYLYVAAFRTPTPDETAWRDYSVNMTVYVNIPIHAANPDFTADDAKAAAIETVINAIESYTQAEAEVADITAEEE